MVGGPGLRFALEAAFLVALAVAAGLAELSPTTIVLVMGAAWLLVAVIEWLAWRDSPRVTRVVREPPQPEPAPAPAPTPIEPVAEPEPDRRRRFWRRRRTGEPDAEPASPPPAETALAAGEDTEDLPPPGGEPAAVPADERTAT